MGTLIIVRQRNYWGKGETLAEARKNYRKAAHRPSSNLASIVMYTGEKEELDRIEIDEVFGGISYPKTLVQSVIQ